MAKMFAILLCVCAMTLAPAVGESTAAEWQNAKFGMSISQVLDAVAGSNKVKRETEDGVQTVVELHLTEIADHKFQITYYFYDNKLETIILSSLESIKEKEDSLLEVSKFIDLLVSGQKRSESYQRVAEHGRRARSLADSIANAGI